MMVFNYIYIRIYIYIYIYIYSYIYVYIVIYMLYKRPCGGLAVRTDRGKAERYGPVPAQIWAG